MIIFTDETETRDVPVHQVLLITSRKQIITLKKQRAVETSHVAFQMLIGHAICFRLMEENYFSQQGELGN